MSRTQADEPQGGSRVAGYLIGAVLGAPLALFAVAMVFRSPGLGVAVGLTVAIIGLTFALRAWSDEHGSVSGD